MNPPIRSRSKTDPPRHISPAVDINWTKKTTPSETRALPSYKHLPSHRLDCAIDLDHPVAPIAIDIGGSLAKVVVSEPVRNENGEDHVLFKFLKFENHNLDLFLDYIHETQHYKNGLRTISGCGGGVHKYAKRFEESLSVTLHSVDEMAALMKGADYLMHLGEEVFEYSPNPECDFRDYLPPMEDPYPFLLVNIGSGVSIIYAENETTYQRVSGTSIGGAMFVGLMRVLTHVHSFDEMLTLAALGDNKNVDMLVRDIYGGDYARVGLRGDIIASSFGALSMKNEQTLETERSRRNSSETREEDFKPEDIACSLLTLICNTMAQLAHLNAVRYSVKNIVFGGHFLRESPFTMEKISQSLDFFSKGDLRALFLRHEGYIGAFGTLLMNDVAEGSEEE